MGDAANHSTQATLAIELSLFLSRIEAVCEEMGAVLQRSALSTNIKDRLDYSCAVFDRHGKLCAQAAHIPVHLGSMAYAMVGLVNSRDWAEGDMLIVNDPYLGGTHLPDVTLIAAVFHQGQCQGFVVNRAHHADIGSDSPGSMPLSKNLQQEGVVIAPSLIVRDHRLEQDAFEAIVQAIANSEQARGDFAAQISANRVGMQRLAALIERIGAQAYHDNLIALNDYAERMAQQALARIPAGNYRFVDYMDDDGQGNLDIAIQVNVHVGGDIASGGKVVVDFSGSSAQVDGNINCPLSVTAAAVYYVFRCLMPSHTPNCDGALRRISIIAPSASLLNANRPAAVAAGNVETSSRVVDALLGALAKALPDEIPAASHGSMNNLALGSAADSATGTAAWSYYETIGGGSGAGPSQDGCSAVQTHMTNTRNTPIEVLELNYPLRVTEYAIRRHSGGAGRHRGGDGIVRRYQFLAAANFSLLTERRRRQPWGLNGGEAGSEGENWFNQERLSGKVERQAKPGDMISVLTPGGGGWGVDASSK